MNTHGNTHDFVVDRVSGIFLMHSGNKRNNASKDKRMKDKSIKSKMKSWIML